MIKKCLLLLASVLLTLCASAQNPSLSTQKAFTQKYVEYAKGYIEKNGLVKAVTDFNNAKKEAKTKGLYIFGYVCGTEKMDGFTLIHPAQPERIYTDRSQDPVIQTITDQALHGDPKGVWVSYEWLNPKTGKKEAKKSFILYMPEYHLCIGSGYYQ